MGLGKTIISLAYLEQLDLLNISSKALIVAPKRVCQNVWPDELKKWQNKGCLLDLSLVHIEGPIKKREKLLSDNKHKIHVVSVDLIPWLVEYLTEWDYDTLILDESTRFKNQGSKRFKSLKKKSKLFDRAILLSGTPVAQSYHGLWAQVFFLDGGERLGKNITAYRKEYFDVDRTGYNYILKKGSETLIQEKIRDIFITVSANDYSSLPEMTYNKLVSTLERKQAAMYKKLLRDFFIALEENEIAIDNAAILANKQLQFTNGAMYTEDGEYEVIHNEKLDMLESIINEADGNILCAYLYKSDFERIKERFPFAENIKEKNAVNRWNDKKIPLLCAHPASASEGLNLQFGGSTIVWFGIPWSLQQYLQFNARLARHGQEKQVIAHHCIIANTIDEVAYCRLKMRDISQKEFISSLKVLLL